MAKARIKEERIRCADCKAKRVHLDKTGRPFLSLFGQPILYSCPKQEHAFGQWVTVADCQYFSKG